MIRETEMFYMVIAAMLWGTTGTAQALVPQGATPLAISVLRQIVAACLLVGIWAWWHHSPAQTSQSLSPTDKALFVLAGVCLVLYQLTFFAGVAHTGVAIGTLIAIKSAPIFAGILGACLDEDSFTYRWYIATLASIIGCGILVLTGQGTVTVDSLGIVLALGAGLSYVLYLIQSSFLIINGLVCESGSRR